VKVVLDTNVVVSGLLSEIGPPGWIVDLVLVGELTVAFDARIIAEYREVLLRPRLALPAAAVETFLGYLERWGVETVGPPWPHRLADRSDEVFLAVANAAAAKLITGNARHFPARARGGVEVVTPRQLLDSWPAR
jgi:putative PIN family toxin of toxin-antitoxin system